MQSSLVAYSVPDTAIHPSKLTFIALAIGVIWLAIAGELLWLDWAQTARELGDSDDAMRLVEVRELLAGRGWYDLHEPRLQPPIGYDTHWSRLIDSGLAGLFLLFRSFADISLAERLMRTTWPLLWLLPAIIGTVAIAWRLGGRAASLTLLLMLLFGLPAFIQFRVGRIDHHDVQITLALLALAAAIWADRVTWAAWVAGVLSGLALAIGFEAMPFIALVGGAFALRFVFDHASARMLVHYGLALAVATAIFFVIGIGPSHWTQTACDAIAINTAAPAVILGFALGIVGHRFVDARVSTRAVAIILAFGLASMAFVLLEPLCLRGPLAMVDPAVRPVWLAHVIEAKPLWVMARESPTTGLGIAAYPIVALIALIALAHDADLRRDSGYIAAAVALIVAVAMTMIAVRAASYTFWFGMPFVAAGVLRLLDRFRLTMPSIRVIAIILCTPIFISWGMIAIVGAISPAKVAGHGKEDVECFSIENYASLARLPKGLVVADVDFGSFLLALTPHSALGAPYHRMSYGIVASNRAFAAPPDEAREVLRRAQANYVMLCGSRGPLGLPDAEMQRSLWTQIKSGIIPDWLEPIPDTAPFDVFRIRP